MEEGQTIFSMVFNLIKIRKNGLLERTHGRNGELAVIGCNDPSLIEVNEIARIIPFLRIPVGEINAMDDATALQLYLKLKILYRGGKIKADDMSGETQRWRDLFPGVKRPKL